MKNKTKKSASMSTRVICAYTNSDILPMPKAQGLSACFFSKHNKVDGMEYICTLDKIHISFHSSSDYDGWLMECNMREEGEDS
jgi:hypothetical protein